MKLLTLRRIVVFLIGSSMVASFVGIGLFNVPVGSLESRYVTTTRSTLDVHAVWFFHGEPVNWWLQGILSIGVVAMLLGGAIIACASVFLIERER